MSWSSRTSRYERLAPSEVQWSTTKSAGMTAPWTEAGFARLATLAIPTLLEAPCRGPYWATVVLQTWI